VLRGVKQTNKEFFSILKKKEKNAKTGDRKENKNQGLLTCRFNIIVLTRGELRQLNVF